MADFFAKRWFLLLMLVGLVYGANYSGTGEGVFGWIQTRYIAGVVLFSMSISLRTGRLWDAVRRPWPALVALGISYGLAPPLAYYSGRLFLPPAYLVGMIVVGCIPCTLASASIWTRLAGGNDAVALLVTVLSNSLVFVFTAGWLTVLTGQQGLDLNFWSLASGLLLYVVLPIAVGQAVRNIRAVGPLADRGKVWIGVFCRLMIFLIIIKSAVSAKLKLSQLGESWTPLDLARVAIVCLAVHGLLLLLGYAVAGRWFSHADAIGVAFASSQKTLPVGVYLIAEYYAYAPLAIVPMLLYHVGQLVMDTYVGERFFKRAGQGGAGLGIGGEDKDV